MKIPCKHETGEVKDSSTTVADFHPLTEDEVGKLLSDSVNASVSVSAGIQVRLNQAIPGMVCPRPVQGKVSDSMSKLDSLYVSEHRKGNDPALRQRIMAILNG